MQRQLGDHAQVARMQMQLGDHRMEEAAADTLSWVAES